MRFAGMRMEGFLDPNRPDMGNIAQSGMANRSAIGNAATMTESQVASAGIGAAGKVESANLIGAATQSQADASTFASGMSMIGDIAGGVMGGMGKGSGFTTGAASNTIADPTDSFAKAGLAGKVYDYWG